jgi:thiamine biosynthesis lipoprotein
MAAERRFHAMGTEVHLIVGGADDEDDVLDLAQARIDDLEQRWSRFLPDSEITRLNETAGEGPQPVSAITFDVVALAVDEWHRTDGVFDPTVLPALRAAGYTTSFDAMNTSTVSATSTQPSPGCRGIVLDDAALTIALPATTAIDLGGIGKGHAADLVADELIDRATSGCVNLGGDMRVWGPSPTDEPAWPIALDDDPSYIVGLSAGAIATSTIAKRQWRTADGATLHHLIDPRTGEPAQTNIRSVTVIAGDAMTAEIDAKVVLITGDLTVTDRPCHIVRTNDEHIDCNSFEKYRW